MSGARAVLILLLSISFHAGLFAMASRNLLVGDKGESDAAVTVAIAFIPENKPDHPPATEEPAAPLIKEETSETHESDPQSDEALPPLDIPAPQLAEKAPQIDLSPHDISRALPEVKFPEASPWIEVAETIPVKAWHDLPQQMDIVPVPRPVIQEVRQTQKTEKPPRKTKKLSRKDETARKSTARNQDRKTSASAGKKKTKSASVSKAALRKAVAGYGRRVNRHVARHRPRNSGDRGTVGLQLSIGRSGSLLAVRVSKSSGSRSLDKKALAAARKAAPYPAPPKEIPGTRLRLNIRLSFR